MPENPDPLLSPEISIPAGVNLGEEVLGGAGPRGEVAGCPTGLIDGDALLETDGNTIQGRDNDRSAGGADSSAWENAPSGEKLEAARQPQNAPSPSDRGSRSA